MQLGFIYEASVWVLYLCVCTSVDELASQAGEFYRVEVQENVSSVEQLEAFLNDHELISRSQVSWHFTDYRPNEICLTITWELLLKPIILHQFSYQLEC